MPKNDLEPELIERLMAKDDAFMAKLGMIKGDILDNLGVYSKSLKEAKGVLPEEGDEMEEISTIKGEMVESWKKLSESLEENTTSSVDALENINKTIVGYGDTLREKLDVDVLGKLEGLSNGFSDSLKSMKGINTQINDYGSKLKKKLADDMKGVTKPSTLKGADKKKDKDKDKEKGGLEGDAKGDKGLDVEKGPKGLAKRVMGAVLKPFGMEYASDSVKGAKKGTKEDDKDSGKKESIVEKDAQVVVIEKFEKDALEGLSEVLRGSGKGGDDDADDGKKKNDGKDSKVTKATPDVATAIKGAMVAAIAGFTVGKVLDEKFGISDKVGDFAERVADKKLDKAWVKDYLPDLKKRWPGAVMKFEDMGGDDIRNPSEKRKMWDQAFFLYKKEKAFKDNKAVEDAALRTEAKAKAEKAGTKYVDPVKKEKFIQLDSDGDGKISDREALEYDARKQARQFQQQAVARAAEGNKTKIDPNKGADKSVDKTEEAVNGTNAILKESAEETAKNQKKAEAQQEEVIDLLRKVADKDQSGGGGAPQMDTGALREASTDHAYNGRADYTDR